MFHKKKHKSDNKKLQFAILSVTSMGIKVEIFLNIYIRCQIY